MHAAHNKVIEKKNKKTLHQKIKITEQNQATLKWLKCYCKFICCKSYTNFFCDLELW